MFNYESLYSANAKNMKKSVIRELLKLTQQPEIISFGGGLPSADTFPVQDLQKAADIVFEKHSAKALQYGTTEGDEELKSRLVEFQEHDGIKITKSNILITSASQQGLDMLAKIFLDPGDCIIAGRPTYLGAIQAMQSYQGTILGVPFSQENDGLDISELEKCQERIKRENLKVKFIYVIPDFQNPSGICWSLEKRKALLDFSYKYNYFIAEDSPYRDIRFIGKNLPSIYQLDQQGENHGNVVMLKTFSKILSPGVRLGWLIADPSLVAKFVVAKQGMDLCSNVFTQKWLAEYMKMGKIYDLIEKTCDLYRQKRNHMVEMLKKYVPSRKDLTWTEPEGGLFLWLALPKFIDTEKMLLKAIEKKVAYVAGFAFYFDNPDRNAMRLNFSFSSMEQIEEGVKRLAVVIKEEIELYESGTCMKTVMEKV